MKKSNITSVVGFMLCVLVGGVFAAQLAVGQTAAQSVEIGLLHLAVNNEERGYALPASGHSAPGCTTDKFGNVSCPPSPSPSPSPTPTPIPTPAPDPAPVGSLDSASCTLVQGWACDGSSWGSQLDVHIYNGGTFVGSVVANGSRLDVGPACGGTTAHGFTFAVPASFKNGSAHSFSAYAIGINSSGAANGVNPLLGTRSTPVCAVPMTEFTAPAECVIPIGDSVCSATLNWDLTGQTDPNIFNLGTNARESSAATGPITINPTYGDNPVRLEARSAGTLLSGLSREIVVRCGDDSVWSSSLSRCVGQSFSVTPTACTIPLGGDSCTLAGTWNLTGQASPNIYNSVTGVQLSTSQIGTNAPLSIDYHTGPIRLQARTGTTQLDFVDVTATCDSGLVWSDSLSECAQAPEITIGINAPPIVYVGQTIEVEWTTSNADTCTASGDWSGSKAVNGTYTEDVVVTTPSQSFTLSCTGSGGTDDATATVGAVTPDVSVDVNRTIVRSGDTVVVSWDIEPWTDVDPAASCTITGLRTTPFPIPTNPPVPPAVGTSGSETSTPITNSRRITLSCTIFGNTYTDQVFIEVIPTMFEN